MFINPRYFKYLDPILFIVCVVVGFYLLSDKELEIRKLLASLSFGMALFFLAMIIVRLRGNK